MLTSKSKSQTLKPRQKGIADPISFVNPLEATTKRSSLTLNMNEPTEMDNPQNLSWRQQWQRERRTILAEGWLQKKTG